MDLIKEILKIYETKTAPTISKESGVSINVIKEITRHRTKTLKHTDAEKIKAWLNGINQNDQKPEPSLVRNDEEVTELKGDVKTLFKELLEIRNRLDALEKKEIAELLNSVKKKH